MALTARQQKQFRTRLMEEREKTQTDLQRLGLEVTQLGVDHGSEGIGASNHLADDATDLVEQEKDLALIGTLQERLREIERAIGRLDEGAYGTCERCGKAIGAERLKARPFATLCISCKELADRQNRAYGD